MFFSPTAQRLCAKLFPGWVHARRAARMAERVQEACRYQNVDLALKGLDPSIWVQNLGPWTIKTAIQWVDSASLVIEIFDQSREASIRSLVNKIFWSIWPSSSLTSSSHAMRYFLKYWWSSVGILVNTRNNVFLAKELSACLPCCSFHTVASDAKNRPALDRAIRELIGHSFRTNDYVLWDTLVSEHIEPVTNLLLDRTSIRALLSGHQSDMLSGSHRALVMRIMDPTKPWNDERYLEKGSQLSSLDQPDCSERIVCSKIDNLSPLFQVTHMLLVQQDEVCWNDLVEAYPTSPEGFWPLVLADLVYSGLGNSTRCAVVAQWLARKDHFWATINPELLVNRLMESDRFYRMFPFASSDSSSLFQDCIEHLPCLKSRQRARAELIKKVLSPDNSALTRRPHNMPNQTPTQFAGSLLEAAASDPDALLSEEEEMALSESIDRSSIQISNVEALSLSHLPQEACPLWLQFLFSPSQDLRFLELAPWALPLTDHWVLERLLLRAAPSSRKLTRLVRTM